MKNKEYLATLATLDTASLYERATALAEELMRLRFKHASRQLEQTHQLKAARRKLATVNTMIRAKRAA
jgi:ribosomal protein L29